MGEVCGTSIEFREVRRTILFEGLPLSLQQTAAFGDLGFRVLLRLLEQFSFLLDRLFSLSNEIPVTADMRQSQSDRFFDLLHPDSLPLSLSFEIATLIGQVSTDAIEVIFVEPGPLLDIDLAASDFGLAAIDFSASFSARRLRISRR